MTQKFYIYLRTVLFIFCIYIYTVRPESLGQDEMNRSCWIDVPIGQDSHWPFSDPVIEKAGTSDFIVKFVLLHIHKRYLMRPALSSRTYTMCVTQWKTTKRGWCMHVAVHVDRHVCLLPIREYRSVLLLSWSINMQNWEMLCHLLHVLIVKQAVKTRLIYKHIKYKYTHTYTGLVPCFMFLLCGDCVCMLTYGWGRCHGRWGLWVGCPWQLLSWWHAAPHGLSPRHVPKQEETNINHLLAPTTQNRCLRSLITEEIQLDSQQYKMTGHVPGVRLTSS